MRKLILILILAVPSRIAAQDQQTESKKVEAVQIEGEGVEQRLSAGLKEELQKLVGQVYDAKAADQLADRIQAELPEFVAASRILPGAQTDRVRLVFAVAKISDQSSLGGNINSRYPVESVEIEGIPRSQVSDALYADMQQMVGKRLDSSEVSRLQDRLRAELGPRYGVDNEISRGAPRHLRVFYYGFKLPWLPFRDPESYVVYHQKQGTSFFLTVPFDLNTKVAVIHEPSDPSGAPQNPPGNTNQVQIGTNGIHFSVFHKRAATQRVIFGAANSADELIERYKGFRFGYENVSVFTNRLGFKFEYAMFGSRWNPATEFAAGSTLPRTDLYRSRQSLTPSLAFAFNRNVYATAGVQFVNLDMQFPATGTRSASAGVASFRYQHANSGQLLSIERSGNIKNEWIAAYEAHTGSQTLDADYIYTRHFANVQYTFHRDKNWLRVALLGGRITGNAPLYDRFSLGDTLTLRGWNKFDVAPVGGNRVAHGSLELGHKGDFFVYYDAGAVWDAGRPIHIRSAIGIAAGSPTSNIALGFRIRNGSLSPNLMITLR